MVLSMIDVHMMIVICRNLKYTIMRNIIRIMLLMIFCFISLSAKCEKYKIEFIGEECEYYIFELRNQSEDTVYFFNSYNEDEFFYSKYLHRYDSKTNECKFSFLPIISLLWPHTWISPMLFGDIKIATYGRVQYKFQKILPNDKITISIPEDAFYVTEYTKEIYPQKLSTLNYQDKTIKEIKEKRSFVFNDSYGHNCDSLCLEFAIYTDIDILNNEELYFLESEMFNAQASSFNVINILIKL